MGTRLLPAALFLSAGSLSAAPVRNLNSIEYEYRDQQLSSKRPSLRRPDHLNILSGRSLFFYEQSKLNAQAEAGASLGNSGTSSFTTLQARSALTWREARSSDALEANWIRTHGADSTSRPLEETVLQDSAPFTGTRIGYTHRHELTAVDAVSASGAMTRTIDGTVDLQSRALTAGWLRQMDKNWINSLNLTRGIQHVKEGTSTYIWELRNDDLWVLNPEWSAQISLGGLHQEVGEEKKSTIIAGSSVAYTLRSALPDPKKDKVQLIDQSLIRRPDLDRPQTIHTQSQFSAGWDRNLDQRRAGDQQFFADHYFVQGIWVVDPEQNLQIDLQRSHSIDKHVPGANGYIRDLANLDYRWNMAVGPEARGLLGTFGLGITQETVKQDPLRYDRQLVRVSYAVSF